MRIRVSSNPGWLRLDVNYANGRLCSVLTNVAGGEVASAETNVARGALNRFATVAEEQTALELGDLLLPQKIRDEVVRRLDGGPVVLALGWSEQAVSLPWEFARIREYPEAPLGL